MNRFLKAFGLLSLIVLFSACKKDDDGGVPPPRDYGIQYATEKVEIETYLKTHYMIVDSETFDVSIDTITTANPHVSIWDQTEYPLQNKIVNSNEVDYTVYYIKFNEGMGEAPTRGDNILVSYRGTLTRNGNQFDYVPFPQAFFALSTAVEGWQEIIPLFKTGVYVDEPNSPNPPSFQNYGAGLMFLPSGLAYYNGIPQGASNVRAYDAMVFSFKLYDLEYTDMDGDGILNKDETIPGTDIADYDTDGDGRPNYLDVDDDGDGHFTKDEIENPATGEPFAFDAIPPCQEGGILKKHLDPACF